MVEILIRFCLGGLIVSTFALVSDVLRPKTFAGLFGAAPSVALASLGVTIVWQGRGAAETEAGSMVLGAGALFVYAGVVSFVLLRFKPSVFAVSLGGLLLWFVVAVAMWYAVRC